MPQINKLTQQPSSLYLPAKKHPSKFWLAQTESPDSVQQPAELLNESAGLMVPLLGALILAGLGGIGFLLTRTIRSRQEWLSQRDQAMIAMTEQAELLRTTLSSIGDAVITTDSSSRVKTMNAIAESLTGWTEEAAKGHPLADIFNIVNEDTRQPVSSPVTRSLAQGTISGLANHTLLIAKDGTETPIDDSAAPIRINGKVVGCVLVFRDITERQQRNNQLRDEQDRLSLALTSAELGQWDINLSTNEANRNLRHDQIFGYDSPLPEWSYEIFLAHVSPQDRPMVDAAFQQAIKDGSTWDFECRIDRADGEQRWILAKGKLQKQKQQRGDHMFGIVADITERKRAEKDIKDARTRLISILEMAEVGTWEYDIKNDRVHADDTLAAMFGRESKQMSGGGMADYLNAVHPGDRERVTQIIQGAIAAGSAYQADYRLIRQDGSIRWVSARGRIDRDELGEAIQLPSVVVDITARKQMEDNLRQLAADSSESDRRKDEFLATLAHELRNPLAPIRNGLQIMRRGSTDSDTLDRLRDMMDRQMTQMVHLIDDLLDVSRISRGKIDLRLERTDLTLAIQAALEATQAAVEAAQHKLTVTHWDRPIYLNADSVRLTQIFSNLLSNASKYSDPGGTIALTVEHISENGDDIARVSIKDKGVGISAKMLPKIFDMFSQVEGSLSKSQGGLGLGLTLVRQLVEMHGGTVSANSEGLGKGSEFVVELPTLPEQDDIVPTASPALETPLGNTRRILIVDDNEDSALTLSMLFEMTGDETQTAYDGRVAIQVAETFRPDIVLLDIGLPELNGYEAAQQIRQSIWGKDMILVALTGWGQKEDKQKSKLAGFDAHMVKPIDHDQLLRLLDELMGSRR